MYICTADKCTLSTACITLTVFFFELVATIRVWPRKNINQNPFKWKPKKIRLFFFFPYLDPYTEAVRTQKQWRENPKEKINNYVIFKCYIKFLFNRSITQKAGQEGNDNLLKTFTKSWFVLRNLKIDIHWTLLWINNNFSKKLNEAFVSVDSCTLTNIQQPINF